jgi:hypothetical protein
VFENPHAVAGITTRQLQGMYLPIGGAIGTAVDSSLLRHRAAIADVTCAAAWCMMTRATLSNGCSAVDNVHPDSKSTSPVGAAPSSKSCHTLTVSASVALTTGDRSEGRRVRHRVCYIREPTCQPCRDAVLYCMPCWSVHVDKRLEVGTADLLPMPFS